ncbi:MAG: RIP metalloprotease RseP [Myxococcota bacterium]
MTALSSLGGWIFAFALLLGVLIAVHELGHFLAAKFCGVRVLKFSLGFGPPVGFGRWRMRWERGGTEYVVAWVPLGGFVKMLGENPGDEDSPEAQAAHQETLGAKRTWQKLLIVFAGPAMNLLLPVAVFMGSLWVGIERPAAIVGTVERSSPAAEAGLHPGDRIVAVGDQPVEFWIEVEQQVRAQPGGQLDLRVLRGDEELRFGIDVEQRTGLDEFRQASDVGWVGLHYRRQAAVIGVPDADSAAARAGLLSGDRVTAVGDLTVEDWAGFASAYREHPGTGPVPLSVEAVSQEEPSEPRTVLAPRLAGLPALGVIPAVLIAQVFEERPAARAGFEAGDLILAVDGEPVGSFASFAETVRASRGRPLGIAFARGGQTQETTVAAELQTLEAAPGIEEEAYLIGITTEEVMLSGATVMERLRNPLKSLPRAVGLTVETTRLFLRGFGKLLTGQISSKNIGGPIEIGRQAHMALRAGWETYLRLMILISINLGILNLLPIPVLDGGQALVFLVEGVKRSPISLRTREIIQQVGVLVLVTIMMFAFWNDLTRHWGTFVDWVRTSAGL